jgi:Fibronectin type III domain
MRRVSSGASAVAALAFVAMVVVGGLVPNVRAQTTPDRSNVVIVLDFSASILKDVVNRNRFGAALERIATRVDEKVADLTAGDATISIVQFAARAVDYPGCTELKLLNSTETVTRFANCLRSVAGAYRKGLAPALTKSIGIDTNYVAAMEQAAKHLPPDAVRPALILLTDGKHDVKGVPADQVLPARDRLFGSRSPFALLPVGMGLDPDPAARAVLESGLESLKVIREMPACVDVGGGTAFEWPLVVFETAEAAGNAVAVALQGATCTFTVAATPTPTLAPTPAAVKAVQLTPGDGKVEIEWAPLPAASAAPPITDYTVRCRAGEGEWIESKEGVSLETKATVDGLTNGTAYTCEVAAVGSSGAGAWTVASTQVTPLGRPAAPGKPTVEALNQAVMVKVEPVASGPVSKYHYECSGDNGGTWPAATDASSDGTPARIDALTNGVEYTCRAFAANDVGMSDASPLSDLVKPCGSALECNPILLPGLGALGLLLFGGLLLALIALFRGRTTGYVVAVVDVVHTANIGHGSNLGIAFVRAPDSRRVTGIVADHGKTADVRIRKLRGGRFAVRDRTGRHEVNDGDSVVVADSVGTRHSLVLRAFATNAASRVASRR